MKKYSNPCYRCGKERIVAKIWKEDMGASEVTVTQNICPDPECQKHVEQDMRKQRARTKSLAVKKEARILARKQGRKPN